jgi:hypothetical protein
MNETLQLLTILDILLTIHIRTQAAKTYGHDFIQALHLADIT